MKIAITGAHSSGKTTLSKFFSQENNIPFVRGDTIKQIMERYFPGKSIEQLSDSENLELERLGLESRIKEESKSESFVSDGCTLNSIAYLKAKVKDVDKSPGFSEFYKLATKNAKNYDFIIYLPPELPLVDDGFRPLSPEFRLEIDYLLLEILKDYKFYTVRGELKERIKQLKNITKVNRL